MKINSDYHQNYLFQTKSNKDTETLKQIKDSAYLLSSAPVQVDISAEAMERYRNTIQEQTPKVKEENFYNLLNLGHHTMDLSIRINEINDGKGSLTPTDYANSMLEAYASLYADIVEGYKNGTRCVYTESVNDRPLTQEEDLAELRKAFESHARAFEKLYYADQETDKMVEKSLRHNIGKLTSDRARESAQTYLREIEMKKEHRKHVPPNISEHIINAGNTFLSKMSIRNGINGKSVMDIISSIHVW